MEKSKRLIIFVLIVIFIVSAPFVAVSISRKIVDNHLNMIPCNSEQLPYYVLFGVLHMGENSYDVNEICSENYEGYFVTEILYADEDKCYFIAEKDIENNKYDWILAELSLNNLNDTTVLADLKQVDMRYCFERGKEYKNRNGYLYNDKIVLNDFNRVIEYDLSTKKICNALYGEYLFPESEVIGRYIDSNTIELEVLNNRYRYDLSGISENNESLKEIYNMKDKKIWNGDNSLCEFFSEYSVSVVNDRVIVIGQCLNFSGEAYAIILEYAYVHNEWIHLGNVFTWDSVTNKFYVI